MFSWLLWVFRPRKEWPENYTLEIGDIVGRLNGGANGRNPNRKMGQMNDCIISQEVLSASKEIFNQEDDHISNMKDGDQIIIINPCDDTLA